MDTYTSVIQSTKTYNYQHSSNTKYHLEDLAREMAIRTDGGKEFSGSILLARYDDDDDDDDDDFPDYCSMADHQIFIQFGLVLENLTDVTLFMQLKKSFNLYWLKDWSIPYSRFFRYFISHN